MQFHPAFKPALAAMCPPVPMQRFRVRVRTENGTFVFFTHHTSPFNAWEAAVERYGPNAHVSVRALP